MSGDSLAIDLDGVCYPFTDAFRGYCMCVADDGGLPTGIAKPLPGEVEYWDFFKEMGWTKKEFYKMLDVFIQDEGFKALPPMRGTRAALTRLKELGWTLTAVTSRKTAAHAQTAEWIDMWALPFDGLLVCGGSKTASLKSINAFALVDDKVENLLPENLSGARGILFDQPWNRHTNYPHYNIARGVGWRGVFDELGLAGELA